MSMASPRTAGSFDVVVIGLNVVDVLARLPREVRRGDKHEVGDIAITGGAPAGNAACAFGRLGWRTGFLARVGGDTLSGISRAELAAYGVSTDLFIDDPGARPAVAVVEVEPGGERTVFYSLAGYCRLRERDVPAMAVRAARLVVTDGYEFDAARAALRLAREAGVASLVDVEAGDPAAARELIALSAHAILPLAAAAAFTGRQEPADALRALSAWTDAQLVVTDGPRGSWALTPEGVVHQPAFLVDAVDTTGCGDSYHGAYGSALLDGLPLPLRMEFAALVASRVALGMGGRAPLPTRDDLRRGANDDTLPAVSSALRHYLLRGSAT